MSTTKVKTVATAKMATIPDHNINNLETFLDVTGEERRVAGLYFYMMLDCLISLAYEVAYDFFEKPHLYTNLQDIQVDSENRKENNMLIPRILARLKTRKDEIYISLEQRHQIYIPLFGEPGDQTSNFYNVTQPLIDAAMDFSRNVVDISDRFLLESVRTAHVAAKEYLVGLAGASLTWNKDEVLFNLTEDVYQVLRNNGVSGVFGIIPGPPNEFPYVAQAKAGDSSMSSQGSKLVERISECRQWPYHSNMYIKRHIFSNVQRAALRGAEALATIIDFEETQPDEDDANLKLLISKCFTWGTALMAIKEYSDIYKMPSDSENGTMSNGKEKPQLFKSDDAPVAARTEMKY